MMSDSLIHLLFIIIGFGIGTYLDNTIWKEALNSAIDEIVDEIEEEFNGKE